jgi:hypothetical protein
MFINIPSTTLKQLVKLTERKEALMEQIQAIDREMLELERRFDRGPGSPMQKGRVTFSASPRKKRGAPRSERGALTEKIVQALRTAGSKGATIRELSDRTGVRSANLYVWFNGTGKNIPGLTKVGTAKYRLK